MQRLPNPFISRVSNPTDWVRDISDDEFEQRILLLSPEERSIAIAYRKKSKRNPATTQSSDSVAISV